ncbi:hypothetical protein DSO57_1002795 [Entomophthora muscae]|uniref:Uncharacterized protein n=1 Tax=Entomophthora muscae TaxID=34485 RepID=A0ACC2RNJ8_9FUNG|nr:hypothetical protein DSO57_1002795 [Entomophthora muscae]
MQAKYKLLTNHSPLLENDDSSKPVPGYDPGHTVGTGDKEPHNYPIVATEIVTHLLMYLPIQRGLEELPHDMPYIWLKAERNAKLWGLSPN